MLRRGLPLFCRALLVLTFVLALASSAGARPLIGTRALAPSDDGDSAGTAEAWQYTAWRTGLVQTLGMYAAPGETASPIVVGMYADANGHPGRLLASATITTPVESEWNTVSTSPVPVVAGTKYWLAALATEGTLTVLDRHRGAGPAEESGSHSLSGLPESWVSGQVSEHSPASFYASGESPLEEGIARREARERAEREARERREAEEQAGREQSEGEMREAEEGLERESEEAEEQAAEERAERETREAEERALREARERVEREAAEGGQKGVRTTECFENPETEGTQKIEQCGYPGRGNTGPEAGTKLEKVGSPSEYKRIVLRGNNERYEGKELWGSIQVEGNNDTIRNDRIITFGHCGKRLSECGSQEAVSIMDNGDNLTVSHSWLGGLEKQGVNTAEECIKSYAQGLVFEYDRVENCGGIKTDGGGTVAHSFCLLNMILLEEHDECISNDGLGGLGIILPSVYRENTLFNPQKQTASLFLQGFSSEIGEVRIEKNFLAGGGYILYGGEEGAGSGYFPQVGLEAITGNRFARGICRSGKEKEVSGGNWVCSEQQPISGTEEEFWTLPEGGGGYYPRGGSYGLAVKLGHQLTWSGNFWDRAKEAAQP